MSGPALRLFDPGLQPERTGLAWRRTAIALAVGSLVALRVLPSARPDWWALAPGFGGLMVAAAMLIFSDLRYRRVHRALSEDSDAGIGDGWLPAITAAGTGVLGLLAVGVLVAGTAG